MPEPEVTRGTRLRRSPGSRIMGDQLLGPRFSAQFLFLVSAIFLSRYRAAWVVLVLLFPMAVAGVTWSARTCEQRLVAHVLGIRVLDLQLAGSKAFVEPEDRPRGARVFVVKVRNVSVQRSLIPRAVSPIRGCQSEVTLGYSRYMSSERAFEWAAQINRAAKGV
jgi:hypothetical protein